MKKTYQSPETLITFINVQQLMVVASPVENGFDTEKPLGTTDATSGNLSRRSYSVWDEEELDEEQEY